MIGNSIDQNELVVLSHTRRALLIQGSYSELLLLRFGKTGFRGGEVISRRIHKGLNSCLRRNSLGGDTGCLHCDRAKTLLKVCDFDSCNGDYNIQECADASQLSLK